MFPGVIEQVLAEQYQPYTKEKTERQRKWESKVFRVANSPEDGVIGDHSEEHPPGYYRTGKRKPREKKPDFKELYQFTAINFLV